MADRDLIKSLQEKPSDVELRVRNHVVNLFRDGALPSPIASALCSDNSCYACYIALELLMENKHLTNEDEKDAIAVAAYLGDDNENGLMEGCDTTILRGRKVPRASKWKCKLSAAWKASVPPQLRKSVALGISPDAAFILRTSSFLRSRVKPSTTLNATLVDPDMTVFTRYPQEPNELGAPVLLSNCSSLADGVLVARIFHIYVNGRNVPVLTDIILLEMVDAPSTTLSDFYKLQLNGFVHEIEANGTWCWARGTIFSDVEIMSTCMIEAAVSVRAVACNCAKQQRKVVSCVETINKWLNIMGLDKKGFRSRSPSLNTHRQ
ncbi:hypothetical protein NECAME_15680 [Necator americanus]|uniref:Uncharacterized protein n=1 Tax=Necator americanus TaxID=51031 RepID=W2SGI8_NECAM|nr:hypothetical protein NECAME_15680 [Necator americanus]ETN68710.1 hypothetical protein NECAME_15680 [Necator americanus]